VSIAEGMLYLHKNGIIHNDLSLETVRMEGGTWKICFRQFIEVDKYMEKSNDSTLEEKRHRYWSPEKYYKQGYDQSSDVWALAILFLELILGKKILALTENVLPCKIDNFPTSSITDPIANIDIRRLLRSMLAKAPQERPKLT
jgi:serine/threonine protein kinase